MALRVSILGIYHESNTFIDGLSEIEDFQHGIWLSGKCLLDKFEGTHHEIGGMIEVLKEQAVEIVPVFFSTAIPGGTISASACDKLISELFIQLDQRLPVDACLVVPHGAAVGELIQDFDGHWLGMLRRKLAPSIPIVGTLDPHANLSPAMIEATDALIAYKTNPHIDQRQTGRNAATLLMSILRSRVRPIAHLVQLPLAISIEQQQTDIDPCKRVLDLIAVLEKMKGVLSISLLLGFPYADVEKMGTSILVITNNDLLLAKRIAETISGDMLSRVEDFSGVKANVSDLEGFLQTAERPALLLDMGDNIGGGARGNSTYLLKHLPAIGNFRFFICIYDPAAVADCRKFKSGANFNIVLCADDPGLRMDYNVTLVRQAEGRFREPDSRHGGFSEYDMGEIALLYTSGGSMIMLTTKRVMPFSLQQLLAFGIQPDQFDIIVAKGVNAPIAAYKEVCRSIVKLDTPGPTRADVTTFRYANRKRPMFPFEKLTRWGEEAMPVKYRVLASLDHYTEGPAVDENGNVFFSSVNGKYIYKLEDDGVLAKFSESMCPNGQIITPEGTHLVCDSVRATIASYDAKGQLVKILVDGECASYKVLCPNDLVMDTSGRIYFSDSVRNNGKVFMIEANGFERVLCAGLDYPNGVTLSLDQRWLFVAESFKNRILKVDVITGAVEELISLPRHSSGKMEDNLPDGMTIDAEGNIWVAHYGMSCLHKVSPDGKLKRTIKTIIPLVSNVAMLGQNRLIVTGGFCEPGPGMVIEIEL